MQAASLFSPLAWLSEKGSDRTLPVGFEQNPRKCHVRLESIETAIECEEPSPTTLTTIDVSLAQRRPKHTGTLRSDACVVQW